MVASRDSGSYWHWIEMWWASATESGVVYKYACCQLKFQPSTSTRQLVAELEAARGGSPTVEGRRRERRDLLFEEASLRDLFDLSSQESVAQPGRNAGTAGRPPGTSAASIPDFDSLDLRERRLRAGGSCGAGSIRKRAR